MDVAIFHCSAGEVSVQGVGRVTDFAVTQVNLSGKIHPDFQPIPRLGVIGRTTETYRFLPAADRLQTPFHDQNGVTQSILVSIATDKGDVGARLYRQGCLLDNFHAAVNDDLPGPDSILSNMFVLINS